MLDFAATRLSSTGSSDRRLATVLSWVARMTVEPMPPSLRQAGEHLGQVLTLIGQHLQRRGDVVERLGERALLLGELSGEGVDRVQRPHDRLLVGIEGGDERGQLVEHVLHLGFAAGERVGELDRDGLHLRDPAAVQQRRKRREDFLELGDCGRCRRAGSRRRSRAARPAWSGPAAARCATNFSPSSEVLRSSAWALRGSFTLSFRRTVTSAWKPCEADFLDVADRHVVDPHRRLRDEVEHVVELDLDVVDLAARGVAAGQGRSAMPSQDASTAQPASAATPASAARRSAARRARGHFDAPVAVPTMPPTVVSTLPSGWSASQTFASCASDATIWQR